MVDTSIKLVLYLGTHRMIKEHRTPTLYGNADGYCNVTALKAAPTPFRRPLSAARLTQCARLRREACHIQFGTLLAAVGPHMTSYDRCQPRQCEEASQKDILLIRRTSRIGPAERHLLRSDW